jgi:hypothetical protein
MFLMPGSRAQRRESVVGSWTPILFGSTVRGNHTYSSRGGRYVVDGDEVFASWRFDLSALDGTASGNANIGGLPFNAGGSNLITYCPSFGLVTFITLDVGYSAFTGLLNNGTNSILLAEIGNNVGTAAIPITNFHNNSVIAGTIHYLIHTT